MFLFFLFYIKPKLFARVLFEFDGVGAEEGFEFGNKGRGSIDAEGEAKRVFFGAFGEDEDDILDSGIAVAESADFS